MRAMDMLELVRTKGYVQCGVSTGLAGFSNIDSKAAWRGIDVDICRAVAAAVLGDATKVRYTALVSDQSFAAVQSGRVDMLSASPMWSESLHPNLGLTFVGIAYYDGQGFMVPKKINVTAAAQLNGAAICVQRDTPMQAALADHFGRARMTFTAVALEKYVDLLKAYLAGRCVALTAEISSLAALRADHLSPRAEHIILPQVISTIAVGPVVRDTDARWRQIVSSALRAIIEAEELGLSSRNIERHVTTDDPPIQRFIGATGDGGKRLGLDNKWAYNIVKQVGNYAEIFDANLGPLGLRRGLSGLGIRP